MTQPAEKWTRVPGFPMYEISTLGRVRRVGWLLPPRRLARNFKRGIPFYLTPVERPVSGVTYLYFEMHPVPNHRTVSISAARTVLETFTGKRDARWTPEPINGDPKDLRLSNLRWRWRYDKDRNRLCTNRKQNDANMCITTESKVD